MESIPGVYQASSAASSAVRGARCSIRMRFVRCVRAFADGAHAVKRGNAERGGEVAVGGAAGGGFVQREAELRGERARLAVEA